MTFSVTSLEDGSRSHGHLNVPLESLEGVEHRLHVGLVEVVEGHGVMHLFEFSFKCKDQIFLIEFVARLVSARCQACCVITRSFLGF